jgi:rfaE bifunctional protein nucleotidyltransferase chain/domain
MKSSRQLKIFDRAQLVSQVQNWKTEGKSIAFTNGCFDLLHLGHVSYLEEAANEADCLVVGLNSDASVSRLKGPNRPLQNEEARMHIMASLACVDAVCVFEEDTPLELIKAVHPDVLVKGGDYRIEDIVGHEQVLAAGGKVLTIPIVQGYSTTNIEKKISGR